MAFTVDSEVLKLARGGGRALDAFIECIWPEVYRVCMGIVRDRNGAEDAAQDACAAIARSLPNLRNDAAFYGWMYRIAGRHGVAAARQSARTQAYVVDVPVFRDEDAAIDLRDALNRLPLAQRTATVLHYYAGLSSHEIGGVLNIPAPTVRFHLMLARRTLRGLLRTDEARTKENCAHVR